MRIVLDTAFVETFVNQYGPIVKQSEQIERYTLASKLVSVCYGMSSRSSHQFTYSFL